MKKSFSYTLVFVFALILSFLALPNVKGQGYGDRNRAEGEGSYNIQGRVVLPDGKPAINVRMSISGALIPAVQRKPTMTEVLTLVMFR